jgi:predicted PhzF superfamily epimerase YddE/YHI9
MHLSQGKVVTDIQLFLVDTFTNKVFHGQPVAVCLLQEELNDELLHAIAIENHQPLTIFIIYLESQWHLRNFSEQGEIHISGSGLFAAAHVVFYHLRTKAEAIDFQTPFGPMTVWRHQEKMSLDIPKVTLMTKDAPIELMDYLSPPPQSLQYIGNDLVAFYNNPRDIELVNIAHERFRTAVQGLLILTSHGDDCDIYMRCFYLNAALREEIISLGAYSGLVMQWSRMLEKKSVVIQQGLQRRGDVYCEMKDEHIRVRCECWCYFQGQLML